MGEYMKIETKVIIYDDGEYSHTFPSGQGSSLLGWLNRKVNTIPEEYRDSADILFYSVGSNDDHWLHILITYTRLETDEEEKERLSHINKAQQKELSERALLDKLKAKYE